MKLGKTILHKPTGLRGTLIHFNAVNQKCRVRVENGRDRIFPASECRVAAFIAPKEKPVRASKPTPKLLAVANRLGLTPDDICHRARMNGLTLRQAIAALSE